MNLRILFATALLCFASLAHADEASHQKAVENLLDTIHAESLIGGMKEQVFAQLSSQISAALAKGNFNEAQKATAQRYAKKQIDLLGETLSWPKMKAFQIAIYMQTFSEAEVNEMAAFYKTPLGQKILERQPKLMGVVMKEVQGQLQALLPKLEELSREMAVEIKKQATPEKK